MSTLYIKTIAFVIIGVLLGRLVGYSAAYIAPDAGTVGYMNSEALLKMALDNAESIEALSAGSSHSGAIDFETLGEAGFHYWHSGGDVYEIRYQLTALLPYLPNLKRVYIATPYAFFLGDNSSRPEVTDVHRRQMYATLPSWGYIKGDWKNFVRGKFHHIVPLDYIMRSDHSSRVLTHLLRGSPKLVPEAREADGYRSHYHNCEHLTRVETIQNAVTRVEFHELLQTSAQHHNPYLNEDALKTIIQLIQFLRNNNVQAIFYTPPYYERYTELYDVSTIQHMKATMMELQEDYGIEYYDFSTDPEISTDYRFFRNADHLNLCGARTFSARLKAAREQNTLSPPINRVRSDAP